MLGFTDKKAFIKVTVTEYNTHFICLTTTASFFLLSTLNISYPPILFYLLFTIHKQKPVA